MTPIQAHTDGHWLRVERVVHRPGLMRRRLGAGWRGRLAAAVVTVAVVMVVAITLVGTTPGSARSTEAPPPVARPAAVAAMPAPPAELAASFARWGREYGVPVTLLEALTWHESRWQPTALSEAGAIGIGQLMPATATALAASIGEDLDAWHAEDNVRMSAHLLGTLLISAGGEARVALAGYAQGASSVERDGMTSTTRQYVEEIMSQYDQFRSARRTSPAR